MKVVCHKLISETESEPRTDITIKKVYDVIYKLLNHKAYVIINDLGEEFTYASDKFISLDEHKRRLVKERFNQNK